MIFRSRVLLGVALLVALVLPGPGCAIFRKKPVVVPEEEEAKPVPALRPGALRVGTITLVNEVERFVLIDAGVMALPAVGAALKSFTGEVASGVVTVGKVNRRPFIVADIVQGAPKKGDGVFQ